jgi:dipeptidyl aminopeptidase/acylaminoacyl peptidase
MEFGSGRVRQLGGDSLQVADPTSVRWDADSSALVCVQAWRGRHRIVRVPLAGNGEPHPLVTGDRQLAAFAACGTHFAYAVDHPAHPSELRVSTADGKGERRLSDFNPWWRERTPIQAEARQFQVPDGRGGTESIEGWLLRAEGAQGPLPLLNDVHGGPAAYALLDFQSNVYWQVLCSAGWAVLALNPVGSASYGREFCDRLTGHWGEYDFPQHRAAIAQLQREGVCDQRLAIAGKSYGGYLTAWAIGHGNDFHAAVVMAPVGNIETHYGTSDGGYYADPYYMGGKEQFDRQLAVRLSPLQYVERATTPTLFLQGKQDERCPKCQSEELFVSLMRAGETPAELVLYPGGDHHFLGEGPPSMREDAAQRVVGWLREHVGRAPPPVRQAALSAARSEEAATAAQDAAAEPATR